MDVGERPRGVNLREEHVLLGDAVVIVVGEDRMAPGPPVAPPGVAREGAETKRSPFGATASARASTTGAYVLTQNPMGGVTPATVTPRPQ